MFHAAFLHCHISLFLLSLSLYFGPFYLATRVLHFGSNQVKSEKALASKNRGDSDLCERPLSLGIASRKNLINLPFPGVLGQLLQLFFRFGSSFCLQDSQKHVFGFDREKRCPLYKNSLSCLAYPARARRMYQCNILCKGNTVLHENEQQWWTGFHLSGHFSNSAFPSQPGCPPSAPLLHKVNPSAPPQFLPFFYCI